MNAKRMASIQVSEAQARTLRELKSSLLLEAQNRAVEEIETTIRFGSSVRQFSEREKSIARQSARIAAKAAFDIIFPKIQAAFLDKIIK